MLIVQNALTSTKKWDHMDVRIDEVRTQIQEKCFFNNEIKQRTKTTLKGKTDRQSAVCTQHTRRKTTDQHKTVDTRRLNREGNEGDTVGATETMIS